MKKVLSEIGMILIFSIIFLSFTAIITLLWIVAMILFLAISSDVRTMTPLLGWAGLVGVCNGIYSSTKLVRTLLKE